MNNEVKTRTASDFIKIVAGQKMHDAVCFTLSVEKPGSHNCVTVINQAGKKANPWTLGR